MKHIKLFSALFASTLIFGGISLTAYSINANEETHVANAWTGSQTPNVATTYYSSCDGKSGSGLKSALSAINQPKSKSYNWSRFESADEAQGDSTSILSIYTRHNIKKSSHVGSSYSWDSWNREHVYTQSAFPNSDDDTHNIFACEGQINGIRGNLKFAEGGTDVTVFGHQTGCKKTNNSFEPCDEAKGEIARAVMYCTLYYDYNITQIFDSVNTCIKWHAEHPVTAREVFRNNTVYGLQGNRNPFVDHPSYANSIYGAKYTDPDPLGGGSIAPVTPSPNPTTPATPTPGPNAKGSVTNPYKVSEALEKIDTLPSGTKSDEVYVFGTISAIDEIYPEKTDGSGHYGNATFDICDDGQTTSPQLKAFRSKFLENKDFTSADQLKVGDKVLMVGKLQLFTKDDTSTKEISECYVYDLNPEDDPTIQPTPTIDPTVSPTTDPTGDPSVDPTVEPTPVTKVLSSLTIVSKPTKLSYKGGEKLDITGLQVKAFYTDKTSKVIANDKLTITAPNMNKKGDATVTVSYAEGGVSKTIGFVITITSNAGCGGSIVAGSALISSMSLIGFGLLFLKKKNK